MLRFWFYCICNFWFSNCLADKQHDIFNNLQWYRRHVVCFDRKRRGDRTGADIRSISLEVLGP